MITLQRLQNTSYSQASPSTRSAIEHPQTAETHIDPIATETHNQNIAIRQWIGTLQFGDIPLRQTVLPISDMNGTTPISNSAATRSAEGRITTCHSRACSGRHAYNPNGPHYPQQVYWGQGTSRDSSRMPNPNFFPRDTIRPMPLNHSMMQYGPGFASRSGPGNGGSGGGYGGGRR
jgi:hypothetical protein